MSRFPRLDAALQDLRQLSDEQLRAVGRELWQLDEKLARGLRVSTEPVTETGVRRLITLAQYLADLPVDYAHFSMEEFFEPGPAKVETLGDLDPTTCGTAACALGHAPMALGPDAPLPQRGGGAVFWRGYEISTFGQLAPDVSDWFFAAFWDEVDNSPEGAAARIAHLLSAVHTALTACWNREDIEASMESLFCSRDVSNYSDLLEAVQPAAIVEKRT